MKRLFVLLVLLALCFTGFSQRKHKGNLEVKGYLEVGSFTTAQRLALAVDNGTIVYDITVDSLYRYEYNEWRNFGTLGSGGTLIPVNGITEIGADSFGLGGTLNKNTTITGNTFDLSLEDLTNFFIEAGDVSGIGRTSLISSGSGALPLDPSFDGYALLSTEDIANIGTQPITAVVGGDVSFLGGVAHETRIISLDPLGYIFFNYLSVNPSGIDLTWLSGTGDLKVQGSAGSSGEILTSQGAGLPPEWAALSLGWETIDLCGTPVLFLGSRSDTILNGLINAGGQIIKFDGYFDCTPKCIGCPDKSQLLGTTQRLSSSGLTTAFNYNTDSIASEIVLDKNVFEMTIQETNLLYMGVDSILINPNVALPISAGDVLTSTDSQGHLKWETLIKGSFADDAAAGLGGVATGKLYETDGTGAAPLNVAGIVMRKQ